MRHVATVMLLAVFFSLSVARADDKAPPAPGGEGNHPCKADAQKLCPGTEPGHGGMMKCLAEHKDQLSAECKAKMEAHHGKMEGNHPCKADGEKLCAGMHWGTGLGKCLHENMAKLSDACKAKMAEHKEHRGK